MSKDKVIFLDIDGVLTTPLTPNRQVNQHQIDLLNYLVENIPDLYFVISSTWRLHGKKYVEDAFNKCNFKGKFHPKEWCTPTLQGLDRNRGLEISNWLIRHKVSNYVVVDDEPSDCDSDFHDVVQPGMYIGLTLPDTLLIESLLKANDVHNQKRRLEIWSMYQTTKNSFEHNIKHIHNLKDM